MNLHLSPVRTAQHTCVKHHTDITHCAHNDDDERCLIYSHCGLSFTTHFSPSMPLCSPAGFLRSPISYIFHHRVSKDDRGLLPPASEQPWTKH